MTSNPLLAIDKGETAARSLTNPLLGPFEPLPGSNIGFGKMGLAECLGCAWKVEAMRHAGSQGVKSAGLGWLVSSSSPSRFQGPWEESFLYCAPVQTGLGMHFSHGGGRSEACGRAARREPYLGFHAGRPPSLGPAFSRIWVRLPPSALTM